MWEKLKPTDVFKEIDEIVRELLPEYVSESTGGEDRRTEEMLEGGG